MTSREQRRTGRARPRQPRPPIEPAVGRHRPARASSRPAAPLVLVVEQIQHSRQPRSNALIGGEWPGAIDDAQDDVGIGAGLQAVTTHQLRRFRPGDRRATDVDSSVGFVIGEHGCPMRLWQECVDAVARGSRLGDPRLGPGVERVIDRQLEFELALVVDIEEGEPVGDRLEAGRLGRGVGVL